METPMELEYVGFVDGASNPKYKRSGIGIVIYKASCLEDKYDPSTLKPNSNPICSISQEIFGSEKEDHDYPTNNEAEYKSLILAIVIANKLNINKITIYMDSLLVVNQVNGTWKINHMHLRDLKSEVSSLINLYDLDLRLSYVPREHNMVADKLSKKAIE